jgi:hypothetical protein
VGAVTTFPQAAFSSAVAKAYANVKHRPRNESLKESAFAKYDEAFRRKPKPPGNTPSCSKPRSTVVLITCQISDR